MYSTQVFVGLFVYFVPLELVAVEACPFCVIWKDASEYYNEPVDVLKTKLQF